MPADLALWPINFSVTGDSLDRLQDDVEHQQGLVRSFLLLKGFEEKDIQLSMPKIVDQHANSYGAQPSARALSRGSYCAGSHRRC